MLNKTVKGSYKYIYNERIRAIILTVIMYILAVGIYFLGYLTMHTNKNIWTIIAVLSILPASKSAIRMIMLIRYKSIPESLYYDIENRKGDLKSLYELIITTSDKSYLCDAVVYSNDTLIILSHIDQKGEKKLLEHLNNSFESEGVKTTVKVFSDEKKFISRIIEMNNNLSEDTSDKWVSVFNLLKVLSL